MFENVEGLKRALKGVKIEWDYDRSFYAPEFEDEIFDQCLVVGGTEGGNCWGDSARYFTSNERFEKERGRLHKFLLENFPDISFGLYSRCQTCVERSKRTFAEYYGNSNDYEYGIIDCDALFELLKDSV